MVFICELAPILDQDCLHMFVSGKLETGVRIAFRGSGVGVGVREGVVVVHKTCDRSQDCFQGSILNLTIFPIFTEKILNSFD